MDVLRDDLFKNKYFLIVFGVLIAIGLVFYFINYNSVKSRCGRYAQGLGSVLSSGDNKLRQLQLQTASQPLIEECIKRGGP